MSASSVFAITYRSTGPVPEYHPESGKRGYMCRYETDDPQEFGYLLDHVETAAHLTLVSVEYDGREVPSFGPM